MNTNASGAPLQPPPVRGRLCGSSGTPLGAEVIVSGISSVVSDFTSVDVVERWEVSLIVVVVVGRVVVDDDGLDDVVV